MINAEFKIDQRFKKKIVARYEKYQLEAGILQDKPHRSAAPASKGLATVAGGPARKKSHKVKKTVADVGEIVRKVHKVNYLAYPINRWRSKDMKEFRKEFFSFISGHSKSRSQSETTLRAVIRNPILRGEYGRNSRSWARIKTFNRKLIDTGQFYRSIIARLRTKK